MTGENDDYTMQSSVMTFTPERVVNSNVNACIEISITDDQYGEPFETFAILVQSLDQRVTIIRGRVTVIIQDNESNSNNLISTHKVKIECELFSCSC